MATTQHDDPAVTARRERPRASDIKQLFERYSRVSRHLDDAERPTASWLSPRSDRKRKPGRPATGS